MKERSILLLYRALLPLLFLVAFPGWIVKMARRGGFGSGLLERIGIYLSGPEFEPSEAIHLHAVSVGETNIALKLLRNWQAAHPETRFVLSTGTSTGHATATDAAIPGLRVTYAPLDFPWMIRNYLNRFEPSRIILIEGEIWPNLLRLAEKRHIPVALANARMSPRSARRFESAAPLLQPFFSRLSAVCIQEKEHRAIWQKLGIPEENIHLTGSIKFDTQSAPVPQRRAEFTEMLEAFGSDRPIVLAASTFPGEETLIASAVRSANPKALPVIVPRHAERRREVVNALSKNGFNVTLKTKFQTPIPNADHVFVVDTTGELPTWTSHADIVIIGKSFLSTGGQNPAEAILAEKPLILGPNMQNFQPLARDLHTQKGALLAKDEAGLITAISQALETNFSYSLCTNASRVLSTHQGATDRHLKVLHPLRKPA